MIPALLLLFATSSADRLIDAALSAGAESEYIAVEGCRTVPPFENTPYGALAERSYLCRSESNGIVRERHFYVTLNGVRAQYVHASSPGSDATLLNAVRTTLTKRYGSPKPVRHIGEIGVYNEPAERWSTPHAQIVLHSNAHIRDVPRDGVQVIGISHDRWQMTLEDDPPGMPLSQDDLKRALPEYARLFDRADWRALPAAVKVLSEAGNAEPERAALLLVGGDVLAEKLAGLAAGNQPEAATRVRKALAPFGITIGEQTHYAGLEYSWEPLWRAATEYPNTEWGQAAFVRLLRLRWPKGESTGSLCPRSDVFARVIEAGEAWLTRYPASKRRAEVMFLVAQAYETWWSAVRASKEDSLVYDQFGPVRAKYVKRAPDALKNAIKYYEEVVQLAPESKEARKARRQLPRLHRGMDTGQRAFLCTMC